MRRLFPLALLSAGCTINVVTPLPERSDANVDVGDDAPESEDASRPEDERDGAAQAENAGDDIDASPEGGASEAGASMDGSAQANDASAEVRDASADSGAADAGPIEAGAADAGPTDASVCGPNPLRKLAPELRIVLDRSGSMRPNSMAGLNCLNPDFVTAQICISLGIDCSDPVQMKQAVCGGTEPPIDYWTPAVAALKAFTVEQGASLDVGLTVFPGSQATPDAGQTCAPGLELVPVGASSAGAIATALDMTQPYGNTPTSATLAAVAAQIEARKAQLGLRSPPQGVLLLTDGAPNCVGSSSSSAQAHQATIAAIDALSRLEVKTWVAGFGSDPALAAQLHEYAVHGGTSDAYPVQGSSLPAAITDATRQLSACSYALDHALAGTDVVSLDGRTLTRDAADGFLLRGTSLQLQGAACATMRQAGTHTLSVAWSCAP